MLILQRITIADKYISKFFIIEIGINGSRMKFQTTIGILLTRFLFLPIVGCGLVNSVISLRLVPDNPLFQFVLLLQFCMPTAINVGKLLDVMYNENCNMSIFKYKNITFITNITFEYSNK